MVVSGVLKFFFPVDYKELEYSNMILLVAPTHSGASQVGIGSYKLVSAANNTGTHISESSLS